MKRMFAFFLVVALMSFGSGKNKTIQRGTLLLNTQPAELNCFIRDGKINLSYVRSVCNFLTDPDITEYEGHLIPTRKKAFIRHIKALNEILEEDFLNAKPIDDSMREIFCELALFNASLKQKALTNNKTMRFSDKLAMMHDTRKSSRVFVYKNEITNHEANDVDPYHLQADPPDSPYWHKSDEYQSDNFFHLAKLKKIVPKKDMVVLFDEPSLSGSSPKIDALDLDLDNKWSVKWGDEVHTDVVGSEIFAALGYDVDHPYFYGENKLTLVFDGLKEIKNAEELKKKILEIYKIDLTPFITSSGNITTEMANTLQTLKPFVGKQYVRFKKCVVEGRPDKVKRIGSFLPDFLGNDNRRELRGALLAHQFIGNWDTREENTLLTLVNMPGKDYRISAVFSDLGTSFGVAQGIFPPDFKVGLVNEFPWEVATVQHGILRLNSEMNSILPCYQNATYQDLLWMAKKIGALDSSMLRRMVNDAHWPAPISELYFHKLASRRASILNAFNLVDEHPIRFDKQLTIVENGKAVVKDGILLFDYDVENNPESFFAKKGRFTNYGH